MRYRSLDGLRGAAAVAVLIHHSLLTVAVLEPAITSHYTGLNPLEWLFTYTPLHILWAGTEAVYLFFVLSGFVLALPFAAGRSMQWRSYFPRRLARLYLPAWGGLAFATLLAILVPRDGSSGTAWLAVHQPLDLAGLPSSATLLMGDPTGLNTPLWSLHWEVLFSLALPLYLLAAKWTRGGRRLLVTLPLLMATVVVGFATQTGPAVFMPMFAMGVALAMNMDVISGLGEKIRANRRATAIWIGLTVVAAVLVTGRWVGQGSPVEPGLLAQMGTVASIPGVVLLVLLALECPPVRWIFERPALQWCGTISFSLYLVHEPIIVSAALLFPDLGYWVLLTVVPVSVLVGWGFYQAIERPAHLFSRWIGAAMAPRPVAAPPTEARPVAETEPATPR